MKKVIALLLILVLTLSFAACSDSGSSEAEQQEPEISEEELINSLVAEALIKAINKGYPIINSSPFIQLRLNSAIDAGNCKMSIGSTEKDALGNITVYGTLVTYDKYGKLVKETDSSKADYELSFVVAIPASLDSAETTDLF